MVKREARASMGTVTTKVRQAVTVDQVDHLLESWIRTVLGEVSITLAPPQETHTGVVLYLLDLVPSPLARAIKERPPDRIVLRYLITVLGTDPYEAHRALGELLFSALHSPEIEVEAEPLPVSIWTSFGLSQRPSLVLRAPLLRERVEERLVPLVRSPMIVKSAPMHALSGVVRGPGDVAILGARVELPALNLFTATDRRGRFHFPTVPSEPPVKLLQVKAKGRTISVPVDRPRDAIIIQLQENEI